MNTREDNDNNLNPLSFKLANDYPDEKNENSKHTLSALNISVTGENEDVSVDFHIAIESIESVKSNVELISLRDFIERNKNIYKFCVLTGIVIPLKTDIQYASLTKRNFRWRTWSYLLYFLYKASIFIYLLLSILVITATVHVDNMGFGLKIFYLMENFGNALQNLLLYPALSYIIKFLATPREIIINEDEYKEHFRYAIKISYYALICMTVFSILYVTFVMKSPSLYESLPVVVKVIVAAAFFILIYPTNFFLSGILCLLIVEQRVSKHIIQNINKEAIDETLTIEKYFDARNEMRKRDRGTPINLIIMASIINTLIALVVIFLLFYMEHDDNILDLFELIFLFGRQYQVLFILLVQVVYVNEIHSEIIKELSKRDWTKTTDQSKRFSVYIAAKENPLGSLILFIRPSKFELIGTLISSVLGLGFAIFWAIVFS